ncbi:hypothetical protein 2204_scaffold812_00025 [Bacteriophage sp.]|nr:hypothetical protein 2204_scaffold812_00025 [Bacteriophage sp.]
MEGRENRAEPQGRGSCGLKHLLRRQQRRQRKWQSSARQQRRIHGHTGRRTASF